MRERLSRHVTGAPESETLVKILALLYSPDEARMARQIPGKPTRIDRLARKLKVPESELDRQMTDMAHRGLVCDFFVEQRRYVMLPPVVIGLFEFVMMRCRDELPMAELSRLFEEYMHADDKFARSVFAGKTQMGRALVDEESLPAGDHHEVLDWERATEIVRGASHVAVALCSCRHKRSHLGTACENEQRVCLSLDYAAEMVARNDVADRISRAEGLDILNRCKEAHLVQIGDNVRRRPTFICNCCSCCCEMLGAIRHFDIAGAVITSNWLMQIDDEQCTGCGKCADVCPIDAIHLLDDTSDRKRKRRAVVDAGVCLGCGVCHRACKFQGVTMAPRKQRVMVPETVFDRVVAMAIERGKLSEVMFDSHERLSHRVLGRLMGVLEKSPPAKAALAIEPIRSVFLGTIVRGAKLQMGKVGRLFD